MTVQQFRVLGSGFWVQVLDLGLGPSVLGFVFLVWGLEVGVRVRVWGSGFRVWRWGSGLRVWGFGFRIWGLGFGVWG